jgi:5-hydroxyisourate hydrolase
MSTISTHVLDTSRGKPASGVQVDLALQDADGGWVPLARAWTNEDGRITAPLLLDGKELEAGTYRLTFETEAYFSALGVKCFYPQVSVVFRIEDAAQHYHVPLLLSPYGYSTYRGS